MNQNAEIIRLDGVSKIYRTDVVETHALSDFDLTVTTGEFVGVSGPSGCGKSTLLSVLGLLDRPNAGRYWINGRETSRLSRTEIAQIRNRDLGFVFQSFNLIGDLTVSENVELPLAYRGCSTAKRARSVASALERVGVQARASHYPSQLSGGEQQRVAVARAIVGEPVLLLADEPTGNLDSKSGNAVMQLLQELHDAGATIVMVTHDPRYLPFVDRTIHMLDGAIATDAQGVAGAHTTATARAEHRAPSL